MPELSKSDAVTAAERLRPALVRALVAWFRRVDDGDISRMILIHGWPSNPPLFPGVGSRTTPLVPDEDDPWAPFEPEDEYPAKRALEVDPPEFSLPQLVADAQVLNDWYERTGDSPADLLIAVSRAVSDAVSEESGRQVWVIPVDMDNELLPESLAELLPADLARAFGASFESFDDATEDWDGEPEKT